MQFHPLVDRVREMPELMDNPDFLKDINSLEDIDSYTEAHRIANRHAMRRLFDDPRPLKGSSKTYAR